MITVGTVAALAIDLGMLYKARSDAQRAAEAASLAGASAFVDYAAADASDSATARAIRFATSNGILNVAVDTGEIAGLEVIPDSQKVRVAIRRDSVGTWFAKMLGVASIPVGASAAAVAVSAGGGSCVKPFAVPDTWLENGDDLNGDQIEEDGETWSYTPGPDTYDPGDPNVPAAGSGYGSNVRDLPSPPYTNDYGRPLTLKLPDPAAVTPNLGPRQALPFTSSGNPNDYRDDFAGCSDEVQLGTIYDLVPVSAQTPVDTRDVVDSLVNTDSQAHWDPVDKTIEGSSFPDWRDSPRAIKFGLFNPNQLVPGQVQVTLNNIGLMFLEGFDPATNAILGRFLYFASGTGDPSNPAFGTLVKRLRLVE
jgi:hypothetical protein